MCLHGVFTNRLANLERYQPANDERPGDEANQQRRERGHDGPQREVLKHPEKAPIGRSALQPLGQAKNHAALSCLVVAEGLPL